MLKICTLSSFAILAQSVEQLTRNEQVVGSIPMDGSIIKGLQFYDCRPFFLSCFKTFYPVLTTSTK